MKFHSATNVDKTFSRMHHPDFTKMTKNKKKQKQTKQNKSKQNSQLQPGFLQVFPQRLRTKLSYADQYTLSGTSGFPTFGSEQSFRLGSLYDPDFTGTGHQPLGFDQVTPWYSRYLVNGCTVKVTFSNPSDDGMYVAVFAKSYDDPATIVNATVSAANERPNVWVRPLNNTGSQKITFQKHLDLAQMSGLSKQQYDATWPTTGALVTSNPAYSPYLSIAVADNSAAISSGKVIVTVELVFDVVFFGRVTPAQS